MILYRLQSFFISDEDLERIIILFVEIFESEFAEINDFLQDIINRDKKR